MYATYLLYIHINLIFNVLNFLKSHWSANLLMFPVAICIRTPSLWHDCLGHDCEFQEQQSHFSMAVWYQIPITSCTYQWLFKTISHTASWILIAELSSSFQYLSKMQYGLHWTNALWHNITQYYCQTSNIRSTLLCNKSIDHSDVVGASPAGAAPTTSSFSTNN